jgi:hypothetical protein
MGYKPDLLVLIERRMNMETNTDEHNARVVKDRSTMLDGKEFSGPTFETFRTSAASTSEASNSASIRPAPAAT